MNWPGEVGAVFESFREMERAALEAEALEKKLTEQHEEQRAFLQAMLDNRFAGIDLLADAWADYELARAEIDAGDLIRKTRPAYQAADVVRAKGRELAAMRRRAKLAEQLVKLYEWHAPWLAELRDLEAEQGYVKLATTDVDGEDPVAGWLTREEYAALSTAERNQRALDRYWRSPRKTRWQLGRDYERYVGWLYERDGYDVSYYGIEQGLEDLGRDVIARRDGTIEVVQCKRWAAEKTIHEKHIFQLFGTVTAMAIDNPGATVRGRFVTTTKLSERARAFAAQLDLVVDEKFPFKADYPCIKCNVSTTTGERIYHLPFDQMYDQTVIDARRGELYRPYRRRGRGGWVPSCVPLAW